MQNQQKRIEISKMFNQMSQALIKDGSATQDFALIQLGSILNLAGAVLLNDSDMFLFSELCLMFSAKKILDSMKDEQPTLPDMLKKLKAEEAKPRVRKRIPVKKAVKKAVPKKKPVAKKKAVPKKKAKLK
jgi:hypothetical protein